MQTLSTQASLLQQSRIKPLEVVFWLLAFAAPVLTPSHALIINEIAIVALFAVSLDIILGYTGIVSLGHAAFFGLGGYAAALFAKHVMPDPLVGLAVGIAAATLLGLIASLTILRGSDLTRLMVTLGLGLILMELANKLDWLTGGADGLAGQRWPFDKHMPFWARASLSAHQPHQSVTGINGARVRARLVGIAGAVHFACGDA